MASQTPLRAVKGIGVWLPTVRLGLLCSPRRSGSSDLVATATRTASYSSSAQFGSATLGKRVAVARHVRADEARPQGQRPASTIHLDSAAIRTPEREKRGKALESLDRSVAAGFHLADYMAGDLDLKRLHGPEFDAPLDRARQNAAAQRAE